MCLTDASVAMGGYAVSLPAGVRSRVVSNINGLAIHILEAGFETNGRPLILLLHGFPELAYSWRKIMAPLAAAGYHQLDAFRDKVLDVALNGKGIERNAAIYALGFYGRDVPEPVLRRLIASEDVGLPSNAIVGARHAVPHTGHANRRCPLCPGNDGPGARAGRSCGEGQAR